MGEIRAAQLEVLELLTEAQVRATDDPKAAMSRRPIVLVAPPRVDYVTRTVAHTLVCLSSHASGTLEALEQLDGMAADLVELLPIESAEPSSYALTATDDPVPALLLRMTGTTVHY